MGGRLLERRVSAGGNRRSGVDRGRLRSPRLAWRLLVRQPTTAPRGCPHRILSRLSLQQDRLPGRPDALIFSTKEHGQRGSTAAFCATFASPHIRQCCAFAGWVWSAKILLRALRWWFGRPSRSLCPILRHAGGVSLFH